MTTEQQNPEPLATTELDEARKQAATYPTRMLAKAYQDAKRAGKKEVADILRTALKARI